MKVLLSIVVSLLPERYRRRWFADHDVDVKRGATVSSILQFGGGIAAFVAGYPLYIWHRQAMLEKMAHATTEYQQMEIAYRGVSNLTVVEYLLLPTTMLVMYLTAEGLVRMLGAVVAGEVLPSFPLAVASWVHGALERQHHERQMGPRIVDEVMTGISPEFDLRIDSCRPKPWTPLITIRYNDELFVLNKEMPGHPPRPYVYMLKKLPTGQMVRGLRDYDPAETLQKE